MTPEDTIIFGTPGSGGFDEVPGAQVGPYKLISPLGEGGFGSVWLAERRHPFVQRVALKLVKAGMDSKAVVARFDQERQALAVMNHPGIAKVFDGGLTAQGRPYFAMEYVKGEPITEFCDRVKLNIDERLKLFEQACEAVQHAHLKGIVHRDLKPGNVLAFMVEGEGAKLKVIDFGVAKAMSQRMTEHTIFTETGQMIGTPEYMSPEQADPTAGDIDTRSDIYSLGVLLYELLVGATPFDATELRKKAYGEIQRTIREQDPPSPSARLSTISTKDQATITRIESARKLRAADLVRRLRGELEWIPQKAMRKEPQHRYQTAMALAEDVRNYLQGKPIAAAPESSAYRMRKYVRRNRGLVIGVGAVMMALVVGLGVATWQWREAVVERIAANRARAEAVEQRAVAETARLEADSQRDEAESERDRANKLLASSSISSSLKSSESGDRLQFKIDGATLRRLGVDTRFDASFAVAEFDKSVSGPLTGHVREVTSVAFSPDGKTVASASKDGKIRLWDALTGTPKGEPLDNPGVRLTSVAFRPYSNIVASGGEEGGKVYLWDTEKGSEVGHPLEHGKGVTSVAVSTDGNTLASGGRDNQIRLWNIATDQPTGQPLTLTGHTRPVTCVAFSRDGATVVSGAYDKEVRRWNAATGELLNTLSGHEDTVTSVAFSPDGKLIASASKDKSIRLWIVATGELLGNPLRGHDDRVNSLAFSRDGQSLASASSDTTIRLWDIATDRRGDQPRYEVLRGHTGEVTSVAFSPDDQTIVSGSNDKSIRLWNIAIGKPLNRFTGPVLGVAFSSDGSTLASASKDTTIRLWDVATGRVLGEPLKIDSGPWGCVAFSLDRKTIASASADKTIRLWDVATGRERDVRFTGHKGVVTSIAFSPDGDTIASASKDKTIRRWKVLTGDAISKPLDSHTNEVTCVAFSPDGKTLASGSSDQTIRRWSTNDDGTAIGDPLSGHTNVVRSIAFSPDGKTLASGSDDLTIRLWTVQTGDAVGDPLPGHEYGIRSVAFSADGKTLASGSLDQTIRLWDVATGNPLGNPVCKNRDQVEIVAFSPDGQTLASVTKDGAIRLWSGVSMPERFGAYRRRMTEVARVRSLLAERIAIMDDSLASVQAFAAEVRADSRFTGDLRMAALIVIAEVDGERTQKRKDALPSP